MVQVFKILFFVGLIMVLLNFLQQKQKFSIKSWSFLRGLGYIFMGLASVFFTVINPDWFHSFDGYACAVAISWLTPFFEERLLLILWSLFKNYSVSL